MFLLNLIPKLEGSRGLSKESLELNIQNTKSKFYNTELDFRSKLVYSLTKIIDTPIPIQKSNRTSTLQEVYFSRKEGTLVELQDLEDLSSNKITLLAKLALLTTSKTS